MSQQNQYKKYCFTLNNYTDEEYTEILRRLRSSAIYFIVGKEVGDQGTPHLQGYFILQRANRITWCRNQINSRSHYEVARGTPSDNRVYCSKGGCFEEFGECPPNPEGRAKGKNRDQLAGEWRLAMAAGRSGLDEFADANPGVYWWSRHTLLRNSLGHARAISRPDIRVQWLYGAPGVGKSRRAHEELPDAFVKEPRTKWWTGYMLEKDVIIDDFGPGGIDLNHLLRWFDRYRCYVETKGDIVPLHADNFIVTSNFHPKDCFKNKEYVSNEGYSDAEHPQLPALLRRVELIEM